MDSVLVEKDGDEIGICRAQFVNRRVRVRKIGSLGVYDQPEWTGYDRGAVGKVGMAKRATGQDDGAMVARER